MEVDAAAACSLELDPFDAGRDEGFRDELVVNSAVGEVGGRFGDDDAFGMSELPHVFAPGVRGKFTVAFEV